MAPMGAVSDDQARPQGVATPGPGATSSVVGTTMNDNDKLASGRPLASTPALDLPPFTGSTSASRAGLGRGWRGSDNDEDGHDRVFTKRDHSPPPSTWYPQTSEVLSEVSAIVERQNVSLLVDSADLFVCPVRGGGAPQDDDEGDTGPAARQAGLPHSKRSDRGLKQGTGGSPRSPVPDEGDLRRLLDNEHLRMSHAPRADAVLNSVNDVHGVSADDAIMAAGPPRSGSSTDDVAIFSSELVPMTRAVGLGAEESGNVVDRGRPSTRAKWRLRLRRERSADSVSGGSLAAGNARERRSDSPFDTGQPVLFSRQTSFNLPERLSHPATVEDTRSMPSSPGGGRAASDAEPIDLQALSGALRRRERLGTRLDGATTHAYYRLVWPDKKLTCNDSKGTPIKQTLLLSALLDVSVSLTSDERDMVVTLSLRTLNFAVHGQLIEQTARGSVLGYYFDRVRIQASANQPSVLVLDSTWPRASSRTIEVQVEKGTSTTNEYGVSAGVEGPAPVASVSATTGRGKNFNAISSLTLPNWTWSSTALSSTASWTWDMSTWADGSLYANDGASLRGNAWPLLHPELVGEASIAPGRQEVRSRWRVHRASGDNHGRYGEHGQAYARAERHDHNPAESKDVAGARGPVVPASYAPDSYPAAESDGLLAASLRTTRGKRARKMVAAGVRG
ncbi:hypothetical protein MMPV_007128 [Pyropia vietnamensis]